MMRVSPLLNTTALSKRRTITVFGLDLWWPFPLADGLRSSCAVVLGWPVYGATSPRWVRPLNRLLTRLGDALWQVRYRFEPKHRYNLVDTGLPPGYHEIDERLLHACMSLLCDYVECRHGTADKLAAHIRDLRDNPDPNAPHGLCESCAGMEEEALAIYRWWKHERPEAHARYNALMHSLYSGRRMKWGKPNAAGLVEYLGSEPEPDAPKPLGTQEELWALEEALNDADQRMLHRVVEIRPGLWT